MRASDADRDRVAEVLREAAGDGRLGLDALDDRLSRLAFWGGVGTNRRARKSGKRQLGDGQPAE